MSRAAALPLVLVAGLRAADSPAPPITELKLATAAESETEYEKAVVPFITKHCAASTSINGHVPTAIPGVRFSAYLPKLAKLADRLTVVRSFQTKHPEHSGAHKQLARAGGQDPLGRHGRVRAHAGLDKNSGRHHRAKICPLVFAGGGLRHGQVVDESDRGDKPATEPITIADLHATILHTLFDVGRMRTEAGVPATVLDRATQGTPLKEFFS